MRRKRTSSGTSSRRRSRTRGRSGSGISPTSESSQARNPRRYVYRPHGVVRPERSVSEDADNSCPVCGSANPREATSCGSCGYSFSDASRTDKVDALLDDLMDLSKAPPEITEPDPPVETEAGKLLRISGRMFDLVTFGSGAALVATFFGFRMYQSLFEAGNPLPAIVFAAIASAGMIAALILFHLSNSEVAQGDRLVKQGRHQEALVRYERAIRMVRRPSYAWTSRGVAMKYLGRVDEALRCHENAIRLDPENEVAWCNLGTVYFRKGELGKALECYDKAIHLRPKYAIAWNNKGVVLARMNQFEEANRCHTKATNLRPTYVAAWLNRGEVLARLGAQEEAQRCLEKARSISGGIGGRATTAT